MVNGLPVQRACQAVGLSRATYYRPVIKRAQHDGPVIEALTALSATNPRWGFWKYVGRLRNTGHRWNHKRLWRVRVGLMQIKSLFEMRKALL